MAPSTPAAQAPAAVAQPKSEAVLPTTTWR